ncbi:MAG: sigma-54-dependent Fis family transcriptional regulator [Syntrophaceae bacterium]|nr:sigma-54-dependent Fis family transcriptional regulator [Syntrophaceae bacterium]
MKSTILIVDDTQLIAESLRKALSREGYDILTAATGKDALLSYEENGPDLILLDVKLPDIDGIQVLQKIRQVDAKTPIIVMTAYSGIKGAVEAMKSGAYDYVAKPFDIDELKIIVARCLASRKVEAEVDHMRSTKKELYSFSKIITCSPTMKPIIDMSQRVAIGSRSTVLIQGESGTGKELFANAIHYSGQRANHPLVAVNCAMLSEGVLESELFGHEKGAFTGAVKQKKGVFELADQGTLFLDEIGEISPATQIKLLRFLEERELQRVGGTKKINVDVRIIAATNRNLMKRVEEGRFREDLYYRLNVIAFNIPPLRERREDIPLLTDHFLDLYGRLLGKSGRRFSREAMDSLIRYPWPGNVRELRNVIERAVLLSDDTEIGLQDVPLEISGRHNGPEASNVKYIEDMPLDLLIKNYTESILARHKNNRTKASDVLGITRQRLRRILKSLPD